MIEKNERKKKRRKAVTEKGGFDVVVFGWKRGKRRKKGMKENRKEPEAGIEMCQTKSSLSQTKQRKTNPSL